MYNYNAISYIYIICMFRGEAAFYPSVNTLGVEDHRDTEEAVDRMVDDLEKQ